MNFCNFLNRWRQQRKAEIEREQKREKEREKQREMEHRADQFHARLILRQFHPCNFVCLG
jgi:hypothetical protein